MRILLLSMSILLFAACQNNSNKGNSTKDSTSASSSTKDTPLVPSPKTNTAIQSLSGTRWELTDIKEPANSSLNENEKKFIADMKNNLSTGTLAFISDDKLVAEYEQDTASYKS
jgi:hypothetical protein